MKSVFSKLFVRFSILVYAKIDMLYILEIESTKKHIETFLTNETQTTIQTVVKLLILQFKKIQKK